MAEFIDDDLPSEEGQAPAPEPREQVTAPEPKIPEKFRGKSMEEIIASYESLEKAYGKAGQELGEVRRLADDLIKKTIEPKPTQQKVDDSDDEIDFFVDPNKAIERAIERHPKLKNAEEKAAEYEKYVNKQRVLEAHPDMYEVVNDPAFAEWVGKSRIRTELFRKADATFDVDAADELLSTFKEITGRSRQQSAAQAEEITKLKASADDNLRKATVSTGSSQEVPKKIYRRADIRNLAIRDPERYEQMQDEFMQAYVEGRVR